MTNPDNVGGLPPQPPIDRFAYTGGSYPMSEYPKGEYVDYDDHVAAMRAYGELCRAAPAGGDEGQDKVSKLEARVKELEASRDALRDALEDVSVAWDCGGVDHDTLNKVRSALENDK